MQNHPNMDEKYFEMMRETLEDMGDEGLLSMFTSGYSVPDKKVTMKAAKKLTDEAACWVCLDDGSDDEGNPLVRDCSCRGNSG